MTNRDTTTTIQAFHDKTELKIHGLSEARYHGERKTLLGLRLTAGLVNLKKLFTLNIDPAEAVAYA